MLRTVILLTLTASRLVNAKPTCKQRNTDVVCTPGSADYILERGLVSDNSRVRNITLRACRIVEVDLESFEELPALEYLDLSSNKIQTLKLGVLDEFKNLKYLNLSHNRLIGFPLGLFDQKPNIIVLDLRKNRINDLELGILDPMTKMEYLDISENALVGRDMNEYIFDQTPLIKKIYFSKNDMSDTPENLLHNLGRLELLDLDKCSLNEVPKFAVAENLERLNQLILSNNKIAMLDDAAIFANLLNLKIINLAENIIESIADNIFVPLKKLSAVVLRGNRLTQIPDSLFRNFPKLINIDLSHNSIEFIPVNAFRGSPLKNLNLAMNKFSYLTENFCLELRNSGGMPTKFYFNQNPWQCACLNDVISEVKKYNIEYNSVKFDGKEPVCVVGDQFNDCERQPSANTKYVDLYNDLISGKSRE